MAMPTMDGAPSALAVPERAGSSEALWVRAAREVKGIGTGYALKKRP